MLELSNGIYYLDEWEEAIKAMDELGELLSADGIKFKRIVEGERRNQILIELDGIENDEYNLISIICHKGSYGYENGLLEVFYLKELEPKENLCVYVAYNYIKQCIAKNKAL